MPHIRRRIHNFEWSLRWACWVNLDLAWRTPGRRLCQHIYRALNQLNSNWTTKSLSHRPLRTQLNPPRQPRNSFTNFTDRPGLALRSTNEKLSQINSTAIIKACKNGKIMPRIIPKVAQEKFKRARRHRYRAQYDNRGKAISSTQCSLLLV